MWNTQEGKRVLQGAERELFRRLASILWYDLESELEDDDPEPFQVGTGVKQFDSLTLNQRFVVLAEVVAALFDRRVPMPLQTQSNEACIAAIFEAGEDDVLNADMYPDFRHLFRAVAAQWDFEIPPLRAPVEDYRDMLESCIDLILWDIDYQSEESFVDLPEEGREMMHAFAGVHKDYYTTLVADPVSVEMQQKLLSKWLGIKGKTFGPSRRTVTKRKGQRQTRRSR